MTGNEPEGLPSKSAGVLDVPKKRSQLVRYVQWNFSVRDPPNKNNNTASWKML